MNNTGNQAILHVEQANKSPLGESASNNISNQETTRINQHKNNLNSNNQTYNQNNSL